MSYDSAANLEFIILHRILSQDIHVSILPIREYHHSLLLVLEALESEEKS